MISRLLLLLSVLPVTVYSSEEAFRQYIQPILETGCVSCHGATRQKGGLRLDTLEAALKGGESGPALVPGDPAKSRLIARVNLHANDDDRMPPKDEPLNERQKFLLTSWIKSGAAWAGKLVAKESGEVQLTGTAAKGNRAQLLENPQLLKTVSKAIDTYINGALSQSGSQANKAVSDEIFVRRAYLDIAGRIPTLAEYEAFMATTDADKRDKLIGDLLKSPGFVSHTLNLWLDALRVKYSHRKIQSQSYIVWLRKAIQENMPYDKFVREQLSAVGHIDNPETAAAGYYIRDRAMPEDRVATTMQLFLGTSMVCAQCHDHPTDKWTQMDYFKLYAFFGGTDTANGGPLGMTEALEENGASYKRGGILLPDGRELNRIRTEQHYKVLGDTVVVGGYGKVRLPDTYAYPNGKPNQLVEAGTPFGEPVKVDYTKVIEPFDFAVSNKTRKLMARRELPDVNSRTDFAKWATAPGNPMFTKTIVNRLWYRVFGVPLIGELTNISEKDMGQVPQLTAYLINLMKGVEYDQRLFLDILYKTEAYQRVALALPAAGQMPMGAPVLQRLSSEQIWDSLVAIRSPEPDAGVTQGTLDIRNLMYVEMTKREGKEQWAFVSDSRPLEEKADPKLAAQVTPDGEMALNKRASLIGSPLGAASFLGVFGQAKREIIDDSVREATITQALYLMNAEAVVSLAAANGRRRDKSSELIERLRSAGKINQETIAIAYRGILSRDPSAKEMELIKSHLEKQGDTAIQDLIWSLINTNEFKLKR